MPRTSLGQIYMRKLIHILSPQFNSMLNKEAPKKMISDYVEVKNTNVGNAQTTTLNKQTSSAPEIADKGSSNAKSMFVEDDLFTKLDSLTKEIDEAAHV